MGDSRLTTAARLRLVADIPNWRPKSAQHSQNARVAHFGRASRNKAVHKKVADALMVAGWPRELPEGRRFTLTFQVHQHRGAFPDSDNQIATLKSARDAIARWLRTTDSVRGPIEWRYTYRRGAEDRVVIELEEI